MLDHIHAALLASLLAAGHPLHDAAADLRAIVDRTDGQLSTLLARKPRNWRLIALLVERRRRCVRAVGEMTAAV